VNYRLDNFQKRIIEIMLDENCTLAEALQISFLEADIDIDSVFDIVDFLEERISSLDDVQLLMQIYTGQTEDYKLDLYHGDSDEKKPKEN
jgi:hypothetical protein